MDMTSIKTKDMSLVSNEQIPIIRTERGLAISGTRITIYDVMDYLKAQYPPKLIREKLGLNDRQVDSALAYIETHHICIDDGLIGIVLGFALD